MKKVLQIVLPLLISACTMEEFNNSINMVNNFTDTENEELIKLNKESPNTILLPTKCSELKNNFAGTPELKSMEDYISTFKNKIPSSYSQEQKMAKIGYSVKNDINIVYRNKNVFSYDNENLVKILGGVSACSKNDNILDNYEKYIGSYLAVKMLKLKEPENLTGKFLSKVQSQVPDANSITVISYGSLPIKRSYSSVVKFLVEANPDTTDFNFSKKEISFTNVYGKFRIYFKETIQNTLVMTGMLHPDGSFVTDGDAISIWLSMVPE